MKNLTEIAVTHPHDSYETLPNRLALSKLKDLMEINQPLVFTLITIEWSVIVGAIYLSNTYWNPLLYLITVIFIGARQHALLIIGHDASHYVLLKNKQWNDWIADIFLFWPMFASVKFFRFFHSDHHRFLNTEKDKNRFLWRTHTSEGELTPEWNYPKKPLKLILRISSKILFVTGLRWIIMSFIITIMNIKIKMIKIPFWYTLLRLMFYGVSLVLLGYFNLLDQFLLYWIIPYCTWHVTAQYIRLICEHSAIKSTVKPYHMSRTTIPTLLDSLLIVPHNISYHHEHHWYPSVPQYHLKKLHQRLKLDNKWSEYSNITHSIYESLKECTET